MVSGFGYGYLVWDRMGVFVFLGLGISLKGCSLVSCFTLVISHGLVLLGLGMGLRPAGFLYL